MTEARDPSERFRNAVITIVEPKLHCSLSGCANKAPYKIAVLKTVQGRGGAYMIRYFCLLHKNAFIERTKGEAVQ